MSQEERYGTRRRDYSAWHRRNSTKRFVGIDCAQTLAMIDLDASLYVEYDDGRKVPLALIETAEDVGQKWKPSTVTERLAQLANLPCYVLLYQLANEPNPADPEWLDIVAFRAMRRWPKPEWTWTTYTPQQWAECLAKLRVWACSNLDRNDGDPTFAVRE